MLAGFTAQALAAEFYVIEDSSTQTLHGRRQKPTGKTKTETIVGENGKVYWTREEAITAMGKEKICVDYH